jgi:hypothetical protein
MHPPDESWRTTLGGFSARYHQEGRGDGWLRRHPREDGPHHGRDVQPTGGFRGKGPRGYTRSDERIREDVCEALTEDDHVDASDIQVSVRDAEVTLAGTVSERPVKHRAEQVAAAVRGVADVHNQLRIAGAGRDSRTSRGALPDEGQLEAPGARHERSKN